MTHPTTRAWSVKYGSLANDSMTHIHITFKLCHFCQSLEWQRWWVVLRTSDVSHFTEQGMSHSGRLPPIVQRYQPSALFHMYSHNFCQSVWWLTCPSKLQIVHQFGDWGVQQCICFVNGVVDNDWPWPGEEGYVTHLISALSIEWRTHPPLSIVSQMWVIDQWQCDAYVLHWTNIDSYHSDRGKPYYLNCQSLCDQVVDHCGSIGTLCTEMTTFIVVTLMTLVSNWHILHQFCD